MVTSTTRYLPWYKGDIEYSMQRGTVKYLEKVMRPRVGQVVTGGTGKGRQERRRSRELRRGQQKRR